MISKSRQILTVGIFLAVFAASFFGGAGVVGAADPVNPADPRPTKPTGFNSFTEAAVDLSPVGWVAGIINRSTGSKFNPGEWTNDQINYIFNFTTSYSTAKNLESTPGYEVAVKTMMEKGMTREEAIAFLASNVKAANSNIVTEADKAGKDAVEAANTAKGETSSAMLNLLGLAVSYFLYFIAYGLGIILMLITKVMLMVAVFNNFINMPPVAIGWTITRDICNNFFIILMIVMAIGTTLNLQNYHWRAMLPKVLLAAVLINFSKMFTGIMIDASQVIMLTFAAPLATSAGYNIILSAFGLPQWSQLSAITGSITASNTGTVTNTTQLGWGDIIAALIFAIIVTIAALVVIVAITGILFYRIIMFWFLIILSPLWIFGKAFNQLSSITSQWESEIRNYLIVGPVMMFFLYLSFMTMATLGASNTGGNYLGVKNQETTKTDIATVNTLTTENSGVNLSNMASPDGLINVLIIVGLLWGSLMMGQKYGGAGKGIAGSAQGWMKKFTGFNLAKSATSVAQKAPAAIGTYVDDKIGLRSKLYGAAYQAGGKFIPGLNTVIGGKIGALESGTSKREQAKIDAAATAMGMGRMTQSQLRAKANSTGASTAQKMAATQTLMKNGWINDDDDANRTNNVSLLDFYRKQLPPDLKNTFDNNIKKSNPNLALQSSIYGGGKDIAGLTADVKDGKVRLADLMKNADKNTMDLLAKVTGGSNNSLMQWMIKNSKDDKEFGVIMAGLSKESKDRFAKDIAGGGIDNTIFQSTDADEKKKLNKMREAYIKSAKDFDFNKLFDVTDAKDLESRDNSVTANQSLIAAEANVKQLDRVMTDVGHLFDPHAIEQIQKRGAEFETGLKTIFEKIADDLHDTDLTSTDVKVKERAKKLMENAFISGSEVKLDKFTTDARRDTLSEILSGKNKSKVLDSVAESNISADFLRSGVKAGLTDADYKRLNKQKMKDGFEALTGQVGTSIMDKNEQAKIYEQALINGATVNRGTTAQQSAMKAALSGSKRSEVLKNISHNNIDDDFVKNNLGSLSAREIRDLSRLSVVHKDKLDSGLESAYFDTNMGSRAMVGGIKVGQEARAREVMSQMAASGSYINLGIAADTKKAFNEVASRFNADTLKNINLQSAPGVISDTHIEALAMNVPVKALKSFLASDENREVRMAIVRKLNDYKTSGDPAKVARSGKFHEYL